jgi:hypothetical protein
MSADLALSYATLILVDANKPVTQADLDKLIGTVLTIA